MRKVVEAGQNAEAGAECRTAGDSKLIYYVVINNTWTYLQGIQRGKNADPSAGASIQRCRYKEIRPESVH